MAILPKGDIWNEDGRAYKGGFTIDWADIPLDELEAADLRPCPFCGGHNTELIEVVQPDQIFYERWGCHDCRTNWCPQ